MSNFQPMHTPSPCLYIDVKYLVLCLIHLISCTFGAECNDGVYKKGLDIFIYVHSLACVFLICTTDEFRNESHQGDKRLMVYRHTAYASIPCGFYV